MVIADPGVDDAFALMYELLHPEIDIIGIVCEYGNVSQEDALRNTAYLLRLGGREDIPLIYGAEKPLTESPPEFFYHIHGEEGLREVTPGIQPDGNLPLFKMIYQLIDEHEGKLAIVNLSRLDFTCFDVYSIGKQ